MLKAARGARCAAVIAICIAGVGATTSASGQTVTAGPGAAPWFAADRDLLSCRSVQPPADRVRELRASGDRAARALPYWPEAAPVGSEPTRFTIWQGNGSKVVYFRSEQDCLSAQGSSAAGEEAAPNEGEQWTMYSLGECETLESGFFGEARTPEDVRRIMLPYGAPLLVRYSETGAGATLVDSRTGRVVYFLLRTMRACINVRDALRERPR